MKTFATLTAGIITLFLTAACGSVTRAGVEFSGVIKEQGFTSYQYGTHTLTGEDSFYAIKSDSLDLDKYVNREVTLWAYKIEGYPVDGGPEYLHVVEILKDRPAE